MEKLFNFHLSFSFSFGFLKTINEIYFALFSFRLSSIIPAFVIMCTKFPHFLFDFFHSLIEVDSFQYQIDERKISGFFYRDVFKKQLDSLIFGWSSEKNQFSFLMRGRFLRQKKVLNWNRKLDEHPNKWANNKSE